MSDYRRDRWHEWEREIRNRHPDHEYAPRLGHTSFWKFLRGLLSP